MARFNGLNCTKGVIRRYGYSSIHKKLWARSDKRDWLRRLGEKMLGVNLY